MQTRRRLPLLLAFPLLTTVPAALGAQASSTGPDRRPATTSDDRELTDEEKLARKREEERHAVKVNRSTTRRAGDRVGRRVSTRQQ